VGSALAEDDAFLQLPQERCGILRHEREKRDARLIYATNLYSLFKDSRESEIRRLSLLPLSPILTITAGGASRGQTRENDRAAICMRHGRKKSFSPGVLVTGINSLRRFAAGFVIFPPHCAPRRGSFRFSSGFSAIFYGAHDVHPGQKDFFQCIELRDLVDARHKRNETILMTKELLKQGTEVN